MTRSEALTFFDANKITLSGISGGQYIDKADFEKFAESLPETQPQEDEGKEACAFAERCNQNYGYAEFDKWDGDNDEWHTTQQLYNIYKSENNG